MTIEAKKAGAPEATPVQQLTTLHTALGLLCGALSRDSGMPWKTRKVFESYMWAIFEQVKSLRVLDDVPSEFIAIAKREVEEATTSGRTAEESRSAQDAALASIETYQAIDSVNGILGDAATTA